MREPDKDGQISWVCSTGSTYHTLDVDDANDTFGPDKQGEKEGVEVLELLESVDDDMDRLGVGMVKISEASAAKYEDGVEKFAVGIMVTNSEFLPPTIFSSFVGSGESIEVLALSTLSLAYPSCIRS